MTEHFEVVEQVQDCRVLFERLQASLSSTWDHYFSEASIYYAEHRNLRVPVDYATSAGFASRHVGAAAAADPEWKTDGQSDRGTNPAIGQHRNDLG